MGLLSVLAYNWWVGAALAGLVSSPDGMFSDLEATGVPHAQIFERLDILAGVLICAGLLTRGRPAAGRRREWTLLMAFGVSGIIGGMFPYACPEGKDERCRSAEWAFQLPFHHYVHMVSGIAEFAFATLAIWLMWRRLRDAARGIWRTVAATLVTGLAVGYPALAVSYLADRWDAPVEAFFFLLFALLVGTVLCEPEHEAQAVVPADAAAADSPV